VLTTTTGGAGDVLSCDDAACLRSGVDGPPPPWPCGPGGELFRPCCCEPPLPPPPTPKFESEATAGVGWPFDGRGGTGLLPLALVTCGAGAADAGVGAGPFLFLDESDDELLLRESWKGRQ